MKNEVELETIVQRTFCNFRVHSSLGMVVILPLLCKVVKRICFNKELFLIIDHRNIISYSQMTNARFISRNYN